MAATKTGPGRTRAIEERFWEKVNRDGPVAPNLGTPCWLWTGARDGNGYGQLRVGSGKGKLKPAHRLAYEFSCGSIPVGQRIDHMCRRGHLACVNPAHLRAVPHKKNEENRIAVANSNNKSSGLRGVYRYRTSGTKTERWKVSVKHNGKDYSGGTFPIDQLAEANAAAIALRNRLFTHNDMDRRN